MGNKNKVKKNNVYSIRIGVGVKSPTRWSSPE